MSTKYIYGSRVREDHREDSDLDVAVVIRPGRNDGHPMSVFAFEKEAWIEELQPLLSYKLHLKGWYGDDSPDISAGIAKSSILVYKRDA